MAVNRPLLTIIVPTYRALAYLPGCMNSIINNLQKELGENVLVRVQDGQSGDGTVEFIHALANPGISVNSEPDDGIYDAMNKAVQDSATPWVYFLGADDRLLPGFLQMLPLLQDLSSIYYGNVLFTGNQQKYDGKFTALKLVYRNICHQAIFYPRSLLKAQPYDKRYPLKADWASNISLMSQNPFRYKDHTVALYNNEDGLSRNQRDTTFDEEKNQMFHTAFGPAYFLLSVTAPLATRIYHFFAGKLGAPKN
ncbi:MAG: glycosyltransferase involved in cell wall biosynthesis [Halioglobus sp.]|jgi:glycosyltransferase involved in cell wall biosynthesis